MVTTLCCCYYYLELSGAKNILNCAFCDTEASKILRFGMINTYQIQMHSKNRWKKFPNLTGWREGKMF